MTIHIKQVLDHVIWLLTVFLLASFQIFDQFEWGRYSFILCSALILFLSALRNDGKLEIKFEWFNVFYLVFTIYIAINSLWSQNSEETLVMARTCFRIWFCFSLLYWGLVNTMEYTRLLTAFVVATYLVSIYSLFYYGFDTYVLALQEVRLDNEYANVNSIAMFLALGIVIELYLFFIQGLKIRQLLVPFSVFFIAAAQSRKAVIMLLFGILALVIIKNMKKKGVANRLLRLFFILISSLLILYFISRLFFFSGVNFRIDLWLNSITGQGKADRSSILRNKFIIIGLTSWLGHPLRGVGIATTHMVTYRQLGVDFYLHNNYIELLCGGGLLAFITYYAMHAYLLFHINRLRTRNYAAFMIAIVLLGLLLLTDYSRVSYYSKIVMFQLMMVFIIVKQGYAGSSLLHHDSKAY